MVRVLIVGTGSMAHDHAKAYQKMDDVTLVGGVDTNADNLAAFQSKFDVSRGFASVDDALAWGEFDAVSNVTSDSAHCLTTLPFLAAGKHVLCEKPLAMCAADADAMAREAKAAGVVNMVNLSYRNVPALMAAAALVASGDIGDVRHFEASYLQSWLTQPAWGGWSTEDQWLWRLSSAHGSLGVLGDVGVHILDFAGFATGSTADDRSCRLTTVEKAMGGRIGDYVLDANDSIAMHVGLENGAIGVIHATRFASGHHNDLRLQIFGTTGGLDVELTGEVSRLRASLGEDMRKGEWKDIECPPVQTNYQKFAAAIQAGTMGSPDFARGAALQRVLDLTAESADQKSIVLDV